MNLRLPRILMILVTFALALTAFTGRASAAPNPPGPSLPVPADYDGDGRTDLSVKTLDGHWLIDFAANGFGHFDLDLAGYGGSDARPVPADYDGDGKADL